MPRDLEPDYYGGVLDLVEGVPTELVTLAGELRSELRALETSIFADRLGPHPVRVRAARHALILAREHLREARGRH